MEGAGEERLDSENPILRCEALTDDFRTVVLAGECGPLHDDCDPSRQVISY